MVKIIQLYCYICGQGYGSKSLSQHLKTCADRFAQEQSHLPIKLQVSVPKPPKAEQPTSLDDQKKCKAWNDEAYSIAISSRNKCPYCNRGFSSEKIVSHVHICSKKPNDAEDITVDKKKTTSRPQLFICGICGREYGSSSISIHLPQCFKQFQNEQNLVDPIARRPLPDLEGMLKEIEEIKADNKITKEELRTQRENAMKAYKDGLAECPTCHRTFESESLLKHLKSCRVREFKFTSIFIPEEDDKIIEDERDIEEDDREEKKDE